jgi:hypothetical protein
MLHPNLRQAWAEIPWALNPWECSWLPLFVKLEARDDVVDHPKVLNKEGLAGDRLK